MQSHRANWEPQATPGASASAAAGRAPFAMASGSSRKTAENGTFSTDVPVDVNLPVSLSCTSSTRTETRDSRERTSTASDRTATRGPDDGDMTGTRKRPTRKAEDEPGNASSADEAAPIIQHSQGPSKSYQAISPSIAARPSGREGVHGHSDLAEIDSVRERQRRNERDAQRAAAETERTEAGPLRKFVEKYGSVELENKGSVARDHLALERTFLAWLRTSLSFASIGIAVTQLFRLNTTIANSDPAIAAPQTRLRHVGKPLGAAFIAISIAILFIGFHRYFEAQHYVIRGKFPASRGSVLIVTSVTGALIVASLAVILAVAPRAFEH